MRKDNIATKRRKIKYPRLELKTGKPLLILPQDESFAETDVLRRHKKWLTQKLAFVNKIKGKSKNQRIYQRSEEELVKKVNILVDKNALILGIAPKKITFRKMKTKWASCSRGGRLTFNLLLRYLPETLIRYVVFHEMAHLLVPNHKQDFWIIIGREFKNSARLEEQLFGYWFLLAEKNALRED